jgi:thiol-disulfide isomerase/thioredoxin
VDFQAPDGHKVALESFLGRPVLLEFWATWCAPCMAAMPALAKLYQEAAPKGLVIILVNEDDDARKATEFQQVQQGTTWLDFHDDGEIARSFPGRGIPLFVLIDAKGRIVSLKAGFNEIDLRAAIASLNSDLSSLNPNVRGQPETSK